MDKIISDRPEAYILRNYRWNFAVNLTETSLALFGRGFIGISTFLPVFVSQFTSSRILIGLVSTAVPAGFLLPQLFMAPLIESLQQKKSIVVRLAIIEKLLYGVLAGLTFSALRLDPGLLTFLFICICFLIGFSGGVTQIGWSELMASIFPPGTHGRYFGTAFFVGGLLGSVGAYLGGLILERVVFPGNYALSFFLGFLFSLISWTCLLGIREPPSEVVVKKRESQCIFLSGLGTLLKADRVFLAFLLAQAGLLMGGMAFAFVAVYAQEYLFLDGYQIGILSVFLLVGGTFGSLVFGWMGDRYGHRLMIAIEAALQILGYLILLLAENQTLVYLSVFLLGLSRNGISVNSQPLVYAYAPAVRRPTYIGLFSTLSGLVSIVSPILAGLISQALGYTVLFIFSVVLLSVALVYYLKIVREPRLPDWD